MSLLSGLIAAFIGLAHQGPAPVVLDCHPYHGNWINAAKTECGTVDGGHSNGLTYTPPVSPKKN